MFVPLAFVLSLAPTVEAPSPGVPLFGARVSPRLEPMVLRASGAELTLTTPHTSVSVRAAALGLQAGACANGPHWRVSLPVRTEVSWAVVEFTEAGQRALPLPARPVSAVAFDSTTCDGSVALLDGRAVRWTLAGQATVAPLGEGLSDPAEVGRGLLLAFVDGHLFRGGVDDAVARDSDAPAVLDAHPLRGAVWLAEAKALAVLTARGTLWAVPPTGPARRLAEPPNAGSSTGLVVWNGRLAWVSDAGQLFVAPPGEVPTLVAELGARPAAPPLVLDLLDEGTPQLVVALRTADLAFVRASGDVERFAWGVVPSGDLVADATAADERPRVLAERTPTAASVAAFSPVSRPLFLEGMVGAGALTDEGLETPSLAGWAARPLASAASCGCATSSDVALHLGLVLGALVLRRRR